MSFIKSLFIKEEEELPKPKEKVQVVTPVKEVYVQPSADFSKLLEGVLEKRNLPGPDFLEFYKALNALSAMPISEEQKYQAAFAGLSVSGLTKEKIVETSDTYLDELKTESSDFQTHMGMVKEKEVLAKRKESEELAKENIVLQQKMADNLAKIGTLNSEAQMKESDLLFKGQQFESSLNAAVQKIIEIKDKVKTHIK